MRPYLIILCIIILVLIILVNNKKSKNLNFINVGNMYWEKLSKQSYKIII